MTDQDTSANSDADKGSADGNSRREPAFKRHGSRYRARRRAVDLLFEAEQRGVDAVALLEERLEMARDDDVDVKPIAEYTEEIVRGVAAEIIGIDSTITEYLSDEWPLRRIPAVDRAILRLSTWELFHNSDIPSRVAVVEGVELASEYSTDVAPPYINAVLDAEAEVADQARMAAAAVRMSFASPTADDEGTSASAGESDFVKAAQAQAKEDSRHDDAVLDAASEGEQFAEVPEAAADAEVTEVTEDFEES